MKRLVEDTFYITAKEAARALPRYAKTGKVSLEIAGKYVQEIAIVSTASNLEGFIKWFICPACQNRVGKLYLPSGETVFLCRKCHDLAYKAQQLRAFKKPAETRAEAKDKYTEKDWMREAIAFLKKMRSKPSFKRITREVNEHNEYERTNAIVSSRDLRAEAVLL